MPYEFKTHRIVEFAETDMAGILHFSNYFRYMEATEHAFFRSLGLRVHTESESKVLGAARRSAECTFHRPLRYEDVVELHLIVREKRSKSISYQVAFRRQGDPAEVARGAMTVVFVTKGADGESLCAVPIPTAVDDVIEVAPPELFAE